MDHQSQAAGQIKDDIFAPSGDPTDGSALDFFAEGFRVDLGNGSGQIHRRTENPAVGDVQPAQGIDDTLNFGQFRQSLNT